MLVRIGMERRRTRKYIGDNSSRAATGRTGGVAHLERAGHDGRQGLLRRGSVALSVTQLP